jgi:hypothetical protein
MISLPGDMCILLGYPATAARLPGDHSAADNASSSRHAVDFDGTFTKEGSWPKTIGLAEREEIPGEAHRVKPQDGEGSILED